MPLRLLWLLKHLCSANEDINYATTPPLAPISLKYTVSYQLFFNPNYLKCQVPDDILNERTKEILEIVDIDGDGEISKEEFVNKAMTCEFISSMLLMIEDDAW